VSRRRLHEFKKRKEIDMRELLWCGLFTLLVLGIFFGFVFRGWPTEPDSCIPKEDLKKQVSVKNSCYCEPFNVQEVVKNEGGVRQPFNTFSNFYVLGTGSVLTFLLWRQRRKREDSNDPEVRHPTKDKNRFRIGNFYPITYCLVLIFLGLGSMFFHASITHFGGTFDNMSMYPLTNFLIFYTIVRLTGKDMIFYIGFPVATLLCLIPAVLAAHLSSLIILLFSVTTYAVLELLVTVYKPEVRIEKRFMWLWFAAIGSFAVAVLFWAFSDTGGALCVPAHNFQYHGVWHWFSGAMAMLLYFYWKKARV
jgi:hypothetical protein